MTANIIKRLPKITGRTFVCGDIHGSYSRVEQFLEFINFDKATDRLIAVGDLVDRGPDNEKCLALLDEPWFHSVKGNHEDLMIRFVSNQRGGEWWFPNGGSWGSKHLTHTGSNSQLSFSQELKDLTAKSDSLPLMISVEQNDGTFFHVIHAELAGSPNDLITTEKLHDIEKFNNIASKQDFDGVSVLWKRSLFYAFCRMHLDGRFINKLKKAQTYGRFKTIFANDCEIIYSGHTIVKQPVQFHRQINLDTCAYGSYTNGDTDAQQWCGLTVTEPASGNYWLVNSSGVQSSEVLLIEPLEERFINEDDDVFSPLGSLGSNDDF